MKKPITKNLTVSLGEQEYGDLDYLVDYYQERSISTVSKSDVIKFMIKQTRKSIEEAAAEKNNSNNSETV